MNAEIRKDKTEKDVPYTELLISDEEGDYEITFRAYYQNVFVGVEDNRDNQSGGADLEDCWIAPTVIIEKTPKYKFDPYQAFLKAMRFSGDYGQSQIDCEILEERYTEIESVVQKWTAAVTG